MIKMIKMTKKILPLAFLTSLFTNCANKTAKNEGVDTQSAISQMSSNQNTPPNLLPIGANIYVKAAVETCDCLSPMLQKAQEIEVFTRNQQLNKADEASEQMERLRPNAEICSHNIREKYRYLDSKSSQEKILEALKTHCPESAEILSKTISMKK